jgi:hypothetical protein
MRNRTDAPEEKCCVIGGEQAFSKNKLILCHLTPSPIALMSEDVIINNRNRIVILHLLCKDYIYMLNNIIIKWLAF